MSRFYLRREPGPRDNLRAFAVALGVGAMLFYLVRLLLLREALARQAPKRPSKTGDDLSPAVRTDG